MNKFKNAAWALAAVAVIAVAGACAKQVADRPAGQTSADPHAGHAAMAATDDKSFLEHMVPHHQDAVDASKVAAERADRLEVKALAAKIISAQETEISQMKKWYSDWYGAPFPAETDYKPMMSDLSTLEPKDVSAKFLEEMVAHHRSAIDMAKGVLATTKRAEIKEMAEAIVRDQQAEIDEMQKLLGASASAPEHAGH